MANKPTVVENIQVLQVGKYGVRVDEKTWFGVNEPLTPANFVPNVGYKVAVSVSKTGKKYINEVLGTEVAESAPVAAVVAEAKPAVKATPKETIRSQKSDVTDRPLRAGFGQPLTEYDLQIQRQISRAGVIQAALASRALSQWAVNMDEYLALVRKAADYAFQYVGE